MQPREHQRRARQQLYASWRNGHLRTVVVIPTGGGKSFLGYMVIADALAKGHRVLWAVHRTELVDRAASDLIADGVAVGVIASSSDYPESHPAQVQVASIQSLLPRLKSGDMPPARLIVVDEAHHMGESAEEWVKVLAFYPEAHVLGLTATPERGDGTGLGPIFTDLVAPVTVRELTALGLLVPCEVVRPSTWLRAGKQSGNPLAQRPLAAYLEHGQHRQGFLYARTVDEAETFAREFTASGVRTGCITATTRKDDRDLILHLFADGIIRLLSNVYVLTEGIDIPSASACILASHPGTAGGFLQRVGRVLRPARGKTDALLIDLPGSSHVHGMVEDERLYSLDGRGIVKAGAVCRVCGQLTPCPNNCEFEVGERETNTTEYTGDKLAKFARMIAQSDGQRRETLLRWLRAAHLKGHKASSVRYKWKAVYQADVPHDWFTQAAREAGYR
jgi:DNA repair protein RadD